jgi:hypothetical protein
VADGKLVRQQHRNLETSIKPAFNRHISIYITL